MRKMVQGLETISACCLKIIAETDNIEHRQLAQTALDSVCSIAECGICINEGIKAVLNE